MASLGATSKMIATYLGITLKEYEALESTYPQVFKAIFAARTNSAMQVTENLFKIATQGQNVEAIKTMLGILSEDYKDKPSIAAGSITQNNIHLTLPSTKEALAYIQADPSIIDGDPINE
jgi:ABC-type sugar transport system ATPase subunit